MMKDRYNYTCTECGTVHKATIFSIIINSIIFLGPLFALMGQRKFYLVTIVWIFVSTLLIQPFILQYKQQKKWRVYLNCNFLISLDTLREDNVKYKSNNIDYLSFKIIIHRHL